MRGAPRPIRQPKVQTYTQDQVKQYQFIGRMFSLAEVPKALKPYVFHGMVLDAKDRDWAVGSCPFCMKDSHFFVKVEDGRFKCQRCDAEGNTYTFLEKLFKLSQQQTPHTDLGLQRLAQERRVSVESLIAFEVVKSALTKEFIVPGYNKKKVLTNLYRCVPRMIKDEHGVSVRKWQIISTPDCKVTPYGLQQFWASGGTKVSMLEGLWDGCTMWDHARQVERILAVPAAGNFSSEWFEYCEDMAVKVMFDNDHPKRYPADHEQAGEIILQRGKPVCPGWDGMQRVAKLAQTASHKPRMLQLLYWNKDGGPSLELPDGYDVRDHLTAPVEAGMVPAGLDGLFAMLHEVDLSSPTEKGPTKSTIKPIECTSFDELCDHYSRVYHMTQNIRDTLCTMLAVILSTEAESINHLWLRVIGPPGSLKSTLAEAVSSAREWVNPKSVITGFHSGFLDPGGDGSSSSLIPLFNNKTVVMKDADTLSNSPVRDQILRELRDLYDGTSRSAYRNKQGDEFENIRMSFILCGTDELRALNRTFLGERFLDCEIVNRGEDTSHYTKRAINNTYESLLAGFSKENGHTEPPPSPEFIKSATYGFIKFLKENYKNFHPPHLDETNKERLEAMGQLVAKIRARHKRDQENAYRPRTEFSTRLGSQFTKLAFFNGLVLQRSYVDAEVMRLVTKIVKDTLVSYQYDIVSSLAEAARDTNQLHRGLELKSLVTIAGGSETNTRRILKDMQEFGTIRQHDESNNSGQRGRNRHVWELSPEMEELWAKVFDLKDSPTNSKLVGGGSPGARRPISTTSKKRTPSTSPAKSRLTSKKPSRIHPQSSKGSKGKS